jgi:hypothetical protein
MSIPSSVLPLLAPGESEKERKNLKLESQHGSIDVELFLTGGKLGDKSKTTLDMRTTHGRITVKLVRPTPFFRCPPMIIRHVQNASAAPRAPLCLTAYSAHNSLNVYLPRSYEGLLKTTTNHGHVIFSAQLAEHITTFSEIDSIKHCFVGDFSEWKDGQEGWNGDEVILGSKHGKIKVWYADEGESLPTKGRNFLSRVLGLSA